MNWYWCHQNKSIKSSCTCFVCTSPIRRWMAQESWCVDFIYFSRLLFSFPFFSWKSRSYSDENGNDEEPKTGKKLYGLMREKLKKSIESGNFENAKRSSLMKQTEELVWVDWDWQRERGNATNILKKIREEVQENIRENIQENMLETPKNTDFHSNDSKLEYSTMIKKKNGNLFLQSSLVIYEKNEYSDENHKPNDTYTKYTVRLGKYTQLMMLENERWGEKQTNSNGKHKRKIYKVIFFFGLLYTHTQKKVCFLPCLFWIFFPWLIFCIFLCFLRHVAHGTNT